MLPSGDDAKGWLGVIILKLYLLPPKAPSKSEEEENVSEVLAMKCMFSHLR